MDALLLCGGCGTRLSADVEKPLYEVGGRPMVDRVRDALAGSRVESVHAVVSPRAAETRQHLAGMATIETPGEGYVADLQVALEAVEQPVLTVAADLPLLSADAVDVLLDSYDRAGHGPTRNRGDGEDEALAVCVPASLKRVLGLSVEEPLVDDIAPTGVNVAARGAERRTVSWDVRFAVNVNRVRDAAVAERLLAES